MHKRVSSSPPLERPCGGVSACSVSGFKHGHLCILVWSSYKPSPLAGEAREIASFPGPEGRSLTPSHMVTHLTPPRGVPISCPATPLRPTKLSASYPPPGSDPAFALPPPIMPLQTPCPPPPNASPPIFDILLEADCSTASFHDLRLVPIAPMLAAGPLDVGEKESQWSIFNGQLRGNVRDEV